MAENSTIARPYAQAIFAIAKKDNEVQKWTESLALVFEIVKHPSFKAMTKNPNLTNLNLEKYLIEICENKILKKVQSFIKVVIKSGRISVIPHICEMFFKLKNEDEKRYDIMLITAYEIENKYLTELKENLEDKFKKDVKINVKLDQTLIGGLKIQLADKVWDLSLKSKLEKMALALIK